MAQLFHQLSAKTSSGIPSILQKYGQQQRSHLYIRHQLQYSNLARNHRSLPIKKVIEFFLIHLCFIIKILLQGIQILNAEYAATLRLVKRSYPNLNLSFSRHLTSSSQHSQKSNESNENKPNGNNDDKFALAMKALFWALTGYMLISVLALMFPSGNQPEVVRWVLFSQY